MTSDSLKDKSTKETKSHLHPDTGLSVWMSTPCERAMPMPCSSARTSALQEKAVIFKNRIIGVTFRSSVEKSIPNQIAGLQNKAHLIEKHKLTRTAELRGDS